MTRFLLPAALFAVCAVSFGIAEDERPRPTLVQPVPGKPTNLLCMLETWSVKESDFVELLDRAAIGDAAYARITELAKSRKADLVGLAALTTRSGQRAVLESIDEVRYAIEFDPAQRARETDFPTAWQTRNVGDTLELFPELGADGKTIKVDLVPQTIRWSGFHDWRTEEAAAPKAMPNFALEKVTTSLTVESGRPVFLATSTPAGQAGTGGKLQLRVLRITAQTPSPAAEPVSKAAEMRVEFLVYTLDRATARNVLSESPNSAQAHAAVRELLGKGQAQIEVVRAFVMQAGARALLEETAEVMYPAAGVTPPSHTDPGTPPGERSPAGLNTFETRNTGVTVELEAIINADARFVDINIVPQVVHFFGMMKVEGVAAKYPPQPVFTTRRITTSVTSGLGVPVLLGTPSQPRATGVNHRKDDAKTSLAFLRVTTIRP